MLNRIRGPLPPEAAGPDGPRIPSLEAGAGLEDRWLHLAGLERDGDRLLVRRLHFAPAEVPYTAGLPPIQPIVDPEDLLDAVAAAVESEDGGGEVERIAEAMLRLVDRRAELNPDRLTLLRARVLFDKLEDSSFAGGRLIRRGFDVGWPFLRSGDDVLLLALLGERQSADAPGYGWTPSLTAAGHRRLELLAERFAEGQPRPVLAAPTHGGGWIDDGILAARLRSLRERRLPCDWLDLAQALLRLVPDTPPDSPLFDEVERLDGAAGDAARHCAGHPPERSDSRARSRECPRRPGEHSPARAPTPRPSRDRRELLRERLPSHRGRDPESRRDAPGAAGRFFPRRDAACRTADRESHRHQRAAARLRGAAVRPRPGVERNGLPLRRDGAGGERPPAADGGSGCSRGGPGGRAGGGGGAGAGHRRAAVPRRVVQAQAAVCRADAAGGALRRSCAGGAGVRGGGGRGCGRGTGG